MTQEEENKTPPVAPKRRRPPRRVKPASEEASSQTETPSPEATEPSSDKPKPAARSRAPRKRTIVASAQGKPLPKVPVPPPSQTTEPVEAPKADQVQIEPLDVASTSGGAELSTSDSEPRTSTRTRRRRRGRGGATRAPSEQKLVAGTDEDGDQADTPEVGPTAPPIAVAAARSEEGSGAAEAEGSRSEGELARTTTAKSARRRRKPSSRRREDQPLRPPGPRTMLVSVGADRHQIAILEKRELVEHYVAHNDGRSLVGNVYMGRVQNVLPGMEAAFLDIGEGRNAVLYAGEVAFDEEIEGPAPRIETMLKSGQAVLAQVTKDPIGSKGARLTTEVSIAGRYLVLVPKSDFIGISRRLPDDERRRLKELASKVRPEGAGLIVRTAAEGIAEEDLRRDAARLTRIHEDMDAKSKKAKPPKLIHSEPDLAIRVVRDLLTTDVEKVVVDNNEVYEEINRYVTEVTPDLAGRIELYAEELPLFEEYHVVEQVRKAIDRKVWLKSGGHLVIDRTEALTVVDVNTGKFVGRHTLEDTVVQTNLEAAEEVAKQLRLRDIGGIIVIDFIDMIHERNRDELIRVLKAALAMDKTRTQVAGGVSDLGLVQMTRKRISEGLLESFSEKCDKCEGRGVILNDLD